MNRPLEADLTIHDIFDTVRYIYFFSLSAEHLMRRFAEWTGPISDEDIDGYLKSLIDKGFNPEGIETVKDELHDFRTRYQK